VEVAVDVRRYAILSCMPEMMMTMILAVGYRNTDAAVSNDLLAPASFGKPENSCKNGCCVCV